MPQTKNFKYDSKGTKSGPSKSKPSQKEQPKLRATAQEFCPGVLSGTEQSIVTEQPIEFQDFPLPSDEYVEYDNPYLAQEAELVEEVERKPLRECDKLEGLDFSTFVVFSNVKNIPLEMQIADPSDGPALLRLCTFGSACLRRTIDCPYTHIPNDEGNWNYQDENVPSPREELDDKPESKVTTFRPTTFSSNTSHLPASISFVSTTSIASTLSSSLTDDSSIDSSDHSPPISPPDSPSRSSSDSSTELRDTKRQERKSKGKVVKTMAPKPIPSGKQVKKSKNLNAPKLAKGTKARPIPIKTK